MAALPLATQRRYGAVAVRNTTTLQRYCSSQRNNVVALLQLATLQQLATLRRTVQLATQQRYVQLAT